MASPGPLGHNGCPTAPPAARFWWVGIDELMAISRGSMRNPGDFMASHGDFRGLHGDITGILGGYQGDITNNNGIE